MARADKNTPGAGPHLNRRRIRALHRRLRQQQGPFTRKPQLPIVDELVMTVLSQATSDANSGRAFARLKERFATWDEVLHAPTDEVADSIRSGGIADVKARRIQSILAEIEGREGTVELDRLHDLDDSEIVDYLCSLPGVGPKTAACVLLFSMGRDAFPVDTHVHRVAFRLGLVGEKTSAHQAHHLLEPPIPAELRYEFHMQLIRHGREICKASRPRCTHCVLLDLCDEGPRMLAEDRAS
ncbi:MAG: endonuclease III domain-containing protein [Actinomycetota bacterium]